MTTKTDLLYEGKAKSVYETDNDDLVIVEFRDDMTAGDGARKETMTGKGYYNSIITSKIFEVLKAHGNKTQFVELTKPGTLVVKKLDMIPLEVIVRNIATGSLVRTFPFEDKTPLDPPIIQTDYKSDEFHDPAINDSISIALGLVTQDDLDFIRKTTMKINDIMRDMFLEVGITLVDFKIEFGKDKEGNIILGDEISPDSCRLWDVETQDMLDKELFRKGQDDKVMGAYEEVFNRLLNDDDKAKWNL